MTRFKAEVTVYDEHDEPLVTDAAFGDTAEECSRAAGALRDRMERAAESVGVEGANGWVGEPKVIA